MSTSPSDHPSRPTKEALLSPLNPNGTFKTTQPYPKKPSGSIWSRFSLKGKTAIISGAGAGIGLSVAQAYAEMGANVVIWYHSNREAEDRAKEIEREHGVKCRAYPVDVRSWDEVEKAVDANVKEFNNRLDIFVANAGIPWTKGSMTTGPISDYRNVMSIDVDGVFYCAKAAAKHWLHQKEAGLENFDKGSFIATASMSGSIVNIPQFQTAYNAAKANVIHMTKSLAVEWVSFARANAISPGYIATEISKFVPEETKEIWRGKTPMGREGQAHELQGAYVYLASEAASYTTGANLEVDGGYTLP